ncbi:ubiquitin carboxyl-terminal hydrolase [Syncephalastrum racemosum]|uniref:Ubiquitin carboxyl-terminal hydrolase n=1 Tax=Syncephalastrum racemosum TaxID=13706 RepID=A0A1X2H3M4_SYNRA|nr:ubiquitin carboxyl-terminal hydrolase [Syncephalastrum racemosum]
MSRDTAAGLTDQPWLFIEPDPASLTTLCTELGVSGVQIEQLSSMDESILRDMRPVYGLILLVRHKPERALRDDSVTPNSDIFFANQVVPEAYGLYAILHVLMNGEHVDPVDIGPQLSNFKDFTAEFPPMLKGLSVTNSKELKGAHNNVARRLPNEEDTVSCHSITYIPFGGYLWELDGFKRGPLRLAPCTTATWFETARLEIQRKIDIYQRQQIPISVWTVIQDRRLVYQRRLFMRHHLKTVIEQRLDACDPDWRSDIRADQWEDEYAHAMDNVNASAMYAVKRQCDAMALDPYNCHRQ